MSSIVARSIDPFLEGRSSEKDTIDFDVSSSENEDERVVAVAVSFSNDEEDDDADGVYDVHVIGGGGGGVGGLEGATSESSMLVLAEKVDANFSKDSESELTVFSREGLSEVVDKSVGTVVFENSLSVFPISLGRPVPPAFDCSSSPSLGAQKEASGSL